MSRSVEYTITDADVAEASVVAMAGVAAAAGRRPLVLSIAAVVMQEVARACADATSEQGDALALHLLERFRAANGDAVIREMLENLKAPEPSGVLS